MDLTTITTAQFQALFSRDFPYLPAYDTTVIYNIGNLAFYNGLFYESKQDGIINVTPAQGANWNKVPGNSEYYVSVNDIQNSFTDAQQLFNQSLWGTAQQITNGYLTLAAHFLSLNMRAAINGIQSVGEQMTASRGAGGVNSSYSIPTDYQADPVLAQYTTTAYGMKYLSMVLPLLRGNVVPVRGAVAP